MPAVKNEASTSSIFCSLTTHRQARRVLRLDVLSRMSLFLRELGLASDSALRPTTIRFLNDLCKTTEFSFETREFRLASNMQFSDCFASGRRGLHFNNLMMSDSMFAESAKNIIDGETDRPINEPYNPESSDGTPSGCFQLPSMLAAISYMRFICIYADLSR